MFSEDMIHAALSNQSSHNTRNEITARQSPTVAPENW